MEPLEAVEVSQVAQERGSEPPHPQAGTRSPAPAAAPASGSPASGYPAPPRIGRAVRRGLSGAYDYLGTVVAASIVWIALAVVLGAGGMGLVGLVFRGRSAGALLLTLLGGIAAAGIGTGPLTAALFTHVRRLLSHEDPFWWELPAAVGRLWRRGLALAGLQVGVSLVFALDALAFLNRHAALWRALGLAFLYPLLFWWSASLLQWPLAAERPADPLAQVVKKSCLLVLDNLGYTAVLAVVVLGLAVLCLMSPMPIGWTALALGWAGTMAFLLSAALRELLPKYGLVSPPAEDDT